MSVAAHTAAYKLFNYWVYIIIPTSVTYTDADTDVFGIVTTGDKAWDQALSTAPIERAVHVCEIAHLVSEGSPITLLDPKDGVKIYEWISEHLTDWRNCLRDRIRPPEPPLEGLYEFNELARLIVPVARGWGLVDKYDRSKIYKNTRAFTDDEPVGYTMSQVAHSSGMFDEIVMLAQARGFNVRRYMASLPKQGDERKGSVF